MAVGANDVPEANGRKKRHVESLLAEEEESRTIAREYDGVRYALDYAIHTCDGHH